MIMETTPIYTPKGNLKADIFERIQFGLRIRERKSLGKGYILNQPECVVKEENNINSPIEEQTNKTSQEEVSLSNGKVAEIPEYMDEQIRRVVNQIEEQEELSSQNIYEGITINDKHYEFHEVGFFEDRLRLHIPTTFVDMPANLAAIKYPSSDRPQIIRTDDTGGVNITLNLIPNSIEDEQIPAVKEGMKAILMRLNPSYLFFEEGVEILEEKSVGFFEFKSPTLGEPLFNLMFFVEMDHNVILGVFNCIYSEYRAWQPIARQMMQSVRVCPKVPADMPQAGGKQS